jgi:lysozyme family protein
VIDQACDARLDFMSGLNTWWKYKNGWSARVEGVRTTAKEMASGFIDAPNRGFDWGELIRFIMGVFKR